MNIYFAGSIRGGREDAVLYNRIIRCLKRFGHVLTEHIGSASLTESGDRDIPDRLIHDRDMNWLLISDVIVAEVTTTSAGVGYEIGRAVALNKKIVCLYRVQPGKKLSAMIAGCPGLTIIKYQKPEEAEQKITGFLTGFQAQIEKSGDS